MKKLNLKNNPNERLAILLNAFIMLSEEKTNSKFIASSLKKYIKKEDMRKIKHAKKLLEATIKEAEKWTD
jgi:hypothetical protein